MSVTLKKIKDQVIVITGASSGIGLATARMAAEKGAKVMLSSRNKAELENICQELNGRGGDVALFMADVSDEVAMQRLAAETVRRYGRIDTWVNNAGVSIYGKLTETPTIEKRRLFDVNFWGVVNGCRAAIPELTKNGGALINIGSILSERVIPLQGVYCATKHAVKAYTDALRMELEAEGAPISVTLVKPGAIDTPYPEHAVNHLENPPTHTPPVYAPELVAAAILECAHSPRRDIYVGGAAKLYSLMETFMPRLTDYIMEHTMMEKAQSSASLPADRQNEALFRQQGREGKVHGDYTGHVMKSSAYTRTALHPGAAALIATGLGVAAAAAMGYLLDGRRTDRKPSSSWRGNQSLEKGSTSTARASTPPGTAAVTPSTTASTPTSTLTSTPTSTPPSMTSSTTALHS